MLTVNYTKATAHDAITIIWYIQTFHSNHLPATICTKTVLFLKQYYSWNSIIPEKCENKTHICSTAQMHTQYMCAFLYIFDLTYSLLQNKKN